MWWYRQGRCCGRVVPALAAGDEREQAVDQAQAVPDGAGVGERAEVFVAVLLDPARDEQARERLGHGQDEVGVVLVVAQADVVVGPVLLDEVAFQHQRFQFAVHDDRCPGRAMRLDQFARLGRELGALLEVGADAVAEVDGLADVDDLALVVFVEVTAGVRGQGLELLFKAGVLDSHALIIAHGASWGRISRWPVGTCLVMRMFRPCGVLWRATSSMIWLIRNRPRPPSE